jgi:hypothetical protein
MYTAGAIISLIIFAFGLANMHDQWPVCGWRGTVPAFVAFGFFVAFAAMRTYLS